VGFIEREFPVPATVIIVTMSMMHGWIDPFEGEMRTETGNRG
jgi:hypothetical protein